MILVMRGLVGVVFFGLVGVFVLLLGVMFFEEVMAVFQGKPFLGLMASFFVLGLVLVILVKRSGLKGGLRRYLLMSGGGAVGFFVFSVLHNMAFAVTGFEEPVFFLLAVIVCPILFLVGVVGSVVKLLIR